MREQSGNAHAPLKRAAVDGMTLHPVRIRIADETVDACVGELLAKLPWNPIESAVSWGDRVVFSYEGKVGSVAIGPAKADVVLGSGELVDGFEAALVGHAAGDSFGIFLTYPESYADERLECERARFSVRIERAERPYDGEIDDGYIKAVSEFGSMDDLRAAVRNQLEAEAAEEERRYLEAQAEQRLLESVYPDGFPADDFDDKQREAAIRRAIREAAHRLGISVSPQDVAEEVKTLSALAQIKQGEVLEKLEDQGLMPIVEASILRSKTLACLIGEAYLADEDGATDAERNRGGKQ